MFINLGLFSRPYGLIKGPTFIKFWKILKKFFLKRLQCLYLYKKLLKFWCPTFIFCPTSIPDSSNQSLCHKFKPVYIIWSKMLCVNSLRKKARPQKKKSIHTSVEECSEIREPLSLLLPQLRTEFADVKIVYLERWDQDLNPF